MEWLIAVLRWNGNTADLLIQTADERLYTLKVASVDPDTVGQAIATQLGIPRARVVYNATKQTLYRRLTYMQYLVME